MAGAACCLAAAVLRGGAGVGALCIASLAMGMLFPTIFGLTLASLPPEEHELGASCLVMAIVGGAVVTPAMGFVSDAAGSVRPALAVPGLCFLGIGWYAAQHARGRFPSSNSSSKNSSSTAGKE